MEQFKVGDWVKIPEDKNGSSLAQIKELYQDDSMKAKLYYPSEESTVVCIQMQHYAKWIPKKGQYNWFYDNETDVPTLAKLISINKLFGRKETYTVATPSCISETSYNYSRTMTFDNCEPFNYELPSNIKDINYEDT